MPFNIFADGEPAEEVFERTENVNRDSIICQTLTILVQRIFDSAYMFGKKSKLVKCFHLHI